MDAFNFSGIFHEKEIVNKKVGANTNV